MSQTPAWPGGGACDRVSHPRCPGEPTGLAGAHSSSRPRKAMARLRGRGALKTARWQRS